MLGNTAGGEDVRGGREGPWGDGPYLRPQNLTARSRTRTQPSPSHDTQIERLVCAGLCWGSGVTTSRTDKAPTLSLESPGKWVKLTLENDKSLRARSWGVEMKLAGLWGPLRLGGLADLSEEVAGHAKIFLGRAF